MPEVSDIVSDSLSSSAPAHEDAIIVVFVLLAYGNGEATEEASSSCICFKACAAILSWARISVCKA